MRSTESILEEYRRADLEKRINLFLECPSLRARFTEIDQSETAGSSLFETPSPEDTLAGC
jgi:hypothetical protein